MKIVFDGTKAVTAVRDHDGFHIFIEEGDPGQKPDTITQMNREEFKPNPIVELHFPRSKSISLLIATCLLQCERHEIIRAITEFERLRK